MEQSRHSATMLDLGARAMQHVCLALISFEAEQCSELKKNAHLLVWMGISALLYSSQFDRGNVFNGIDNGPEGSQSVVRGAVGGSAVPRRARIDLEKKGEEAVYATSR